MDKVILSIIVPCFNSEKYITETLRSIELNQHNNVEFILIDGGSSDKTMSMVNDFSYCFCHILSEPDSGQSDAINKGLKLARGSYFSWLNSDDYYEPHIMDSVISEIIKADGKVVSYACNFFSNKSKSLYVLKPENLDYSNVLPFWRRSFKWAQPATFFPKNSDVGLLDTRLHLAMDYDFLLRSLKSSGPAKTFTNVVVNFRVHVEAKTASMGYKIAEEVPSIIKSNDSIGITSSKEYDQFMIRCNIIIAKNAFLSGNFRKGSLILLMSLSKMPLFLLLSVVMFYTQKYLFKKPVDFFRVV